MTATAPTDLLVLDVIEAEARKVMAQRAALKRVPGTHGKRGEMVADVDCLLDLWAKLDHASA